MKNKRGNVAVIAIIIVIVAITASVITWIVATKSQAPVQQAVVNQPTPDTKTKPISQPAQVDTSSDWKMYTSNLGFSFEYPKNWSCNITKGSFPKNSTIVEVGVGCTDIARKTEFDNIPDKLGGAAYYKNDLDVDFSGYETISEYLKDPTTEKIGSVVLGGKAAYDVIIGGYGANYGIVTEFDGKVLVLSFLPDSKSKIGDIEKHIISSFKFTK